MRKVLLIFLCLFVAVGLAAETIVLQPGPTDGKDAFITSLQPNSNFGSHIHLMTNTMSG